MPEVLQEYDVRANTEGDCVIEVAGISNADLFRLRVIVNSVDLDIGYIQLYYMV